MELTWMKWHSERNRPFSLFGVEGWMGCGIFLVFFFILPSSILLLKMQAAGLDSFSNNNR